MKSKVNVKEKADFDVEKSGGAKYIAGIDEVGRGPLAGPVVCAAVILPYDGEIIDGINDSKKVSEKNANCSINSFVKRLSPCPSRKSNPTKSTNSISCGRPKNV